MSGGRFNYIQYRILDIIDSIDEELEIQGKPREDLHDFFRKEYYEKYPEDKFNYTYPEDIRGEFLLGMKILKVAHIYAQRIDWLLSGDDDEDSFRERLKEELGELDYVIKTDSELKIKG